jgi:hypothetical protein
MISRACESSETAADAGECRVARKSQEKNSSRGRWISRQRFTLSSEAIKPARFEARSLALSPFDFRGLLELLLRWE